MSIPCACVCFLVFMVVVDCLNNRVFTLLSFSSSIADILTNEQLVVRFEKWMNSQGLKYASKAKQQSKLSGSTDMGNITHAIPGIHPMFNIINLEGIDAPSGGLHTVEFAAAAATPVAHTATLRASKALAMTGVECILDSEFLRLVKQEFESRDD